jgi:hypothetical protein
MVDGLKSTLLTEFSRCEKVNILTNNYTSEVIKGSFFLSDDARKGDEEKLMLLVRMPSYLVL